jgi:alkanesulfonate monooxygenase SsuD/methylene tetrahydromethanopterin reductase-like flavin-dependent oxidoreductase (luciferase family)
VGTGCKALPLDNPARIAEDYAVLDSQLNGRLIFGVGHNQERPDHHVEACDSHARELCAEPAPQGQIACASWCTTGS